MVKLVPIPVIVVHDEVVEIHSKGNGHVTIEPSQTISSDDNKNEKWRKIATV